MFTNQNLLGKPLVLNRRIAKAKRKNPVFLGILILSLFGFAFCISEVILSGFGKSLCQADTCQVVESFALLPRPLLAGIAASYFFIQALLAYGVWRGWPYGLNLLTFLATGALGLESILLGRQFFDYHLSCPFCLTVAAFAILSALMALLASRKFVVLGAITGALLAFALTPLSVSPLNKIATKRIYRGNPQEKMILIYAPNCPHCHEVLSFCKNLSDIDLLLCPRQKAQAFMHTLDIKGVPVLIIDRDGEKEILVGSKLILSYLKSQQVSQTTLPPLEELLAPEGICSEVQKCEP